LPTKYRAAWGIAAATNQRARRDHETTSSVIRKALRNYLDVA